MHIENFVIKEFKCFKDFELKDLRQVNIFLGDNNIGKTSILEALLFDEEPKAFLYNLHNLILWKFDSQLPLKTYQRQNFPFEKYYEYFFSRSSNNRGIEFIYTLKNSQTPKKFKLSIVSSNDLTSFEIQKLKLNLVSLDTQIPEEILKLQDGEIVSYSFPNYSSLKGKNAGYIPFIKSNLLYSADLIAFFASIENSRTKRGDFIDKLKIFIKDIDDIRIDATSQDSLSLSIFEKGVDGSIPLATMGDGTIRLFRILAEIEQCRGSRLMIDEIDNGLHYSKQKEFWRVILIAAKENNTQLFITTHSHECLVNLQKAINESVELDYYREELACYTVHKNTIKNEIEAFRYDYLNFDYCINREVELRGEAN